MKKWIYQKVLPSVGKDFLWDLAMDGWIFIGPDLNGKLCFKHSVEG